MTEHVPDRPFAACLLVEGTDDQDFFIQLLNASRI